MVNKILSNSIPARRIISKLYKFADDCKVVKSISNANDHYKLQSDLDKLDGWADKWGMKFNSSKCSILNFGNNNCHFGYDLGGDWLVSKDKEKDLGVFIDNKLKFRDQCISVRNKANRILGFMRKNVSYKSKYVIKSLYNSYVRPHIEYCIQAWKPHLRHNIDLGLLN